MKRLYVLVIVALVGGLLILAGCTREVERPSTTTPLPEPRIPAVGTRSPGDLFMQVTNLPKESVVRVGTITVKGVTTPDALVSVNGVLANVDSSGRFAAPVSLQEAPNLVEVVASDFRGNKVSSVLTIIYIP